MDQRQRQSPSGSGKSIDTGRQKSFQQTTDSCERISDLSKRLGSSLYVSKKPESKSTDEQANEVFNTSESSSCVKRREQETIYSQSSLKETESDSCESISRRDHTPEISKIVSDKPSPSIKETENPKQDVTVQEQPLVQEYILPGTQNVSSVYSNLYPTSYCSANSAFLPGSVNPIQNQECVYPGQYPHQSLMDPNVVYRQDTDRLHYQYKTFHSTLGPNSTCLNQFPLPDRTQMIPHQYLAPPTNNRTPAMPVAQFSGNRSTSYNDPLPHIMKNATSMRDVKRQSYYNNPMPPIKTNAIPIKYIKRSSYYNNPMPPIKTNATPMQCVERSSYYNNPMPPIKTNATPMQYVKRSAYYNNPMPAIKTNATPVKYVPKSSHFQNTMPSYETNATPINYDQHSSRYRNSTFLGRRKTNSLQYVQPLQADSLTSSRVMDCSKNVSESRENSIPIQVLNLAPIQSQISTPKETGNQNSSNQEKTKSVTDLDKLSKEAHYSKKNMLEINIPTSVPEPSHFPLYPQLKGDTLLRPVPRTTNQFPTPLRRGNCGFILAVRRGSISNLPHQSAGYYAPSNAYSYVHPTVTDQVVSRPAIQDANLIQSVSNSINQIQLDVQSQVMTPQYHLTMQNLNAAPQYQDPNNPIFQYGTQYEPALHNIIDSQYQNPNHPTFQCGMPYQPPMQNQYFNFQYQNPNQPTSQYAMQYQPPVQNQSLDSHYNNPNQPSFQYGMQYQPLLQNQYPDSQYMDPNLLMHQYGTQYQQNMQNPATDFQYQDPNLPINPYGTYASSESFRPTDIPCSYGTFDVNIPSQHTSKILPMQTFATNTSSTNMIQTPTDPNVSELQKCVENPSLNMSQHTPGLYATNESSNSICTDDPSQGSNDYQGYVSTNDPNEMHTYVYPKWSVATGDSHEDVDDRDKASKNQ